MHWIAFFRERQHRQHWRWFRLSSSLIRISLRRLDWLELNRTILWHCTSLIRLIHVNMASFRAYHLLDWLHLHSGWRSKLQLTLLVRSWFRDIDLFLLRLQHCQSILNNLFRDCWCRWPWILLLAQVASQFFEVLALTEHLNFKVAASRPKFTFRLAQLLERLFLRSSHLFEGPCHLVLLMWGWVLGRDKLPASNAYFAVLRRPFNF